MLRKEVGKLLRISLILLLFFIPIVLANQDPRDAEFLAIYLIFILTIMIAITVILFFVRKLKFNIKKVGASIGISIVMTLWVELLFFIVGSFSGLFEVFCKNPETCPTQYQMFMKAFPYTATIIFFFTILNYYIMAYVKYKE
jgi:hypothetical protein